MSGINGTTGMSIVKDIKNNEFEKTDEGLTQKKFLEIIAQITGSSKNRAPHHMEPFSETHCYIYADDNNCIGIFPNSFWEECEKLIKLKK